MFRLFIVGGTFFFSTLPLDSSSFTRLLKQMVKSFVRRSICRIASGLVDGCDIVANVFIACKDRKYPKNEYFHFIH